MNIAVAPETVETLPALVDRAASALSGARSSAEVLEARDMASVAYTVAQKAARLATAKGAHDSLVAAAHRAQADALLIESQAKRRLADEYDAAQERGEVASAGGERSGREHSPTAPTAADIGLTRKQVHEARQIRDAEEREPGIVKRAVEERLAEGKEPSRASVRRVITPETHKPAPARGRAAICERVVEAIRALNGLPPAHEVVSFFKESDASILISERLSPAVEWLMEFADAWPKGEDA